MDDNFKKQVLEWAGQTDLLKPENVGALSMRLSMAFTDLNTAILSDNREKQIDAIGDTHVFLVILCAKLGIDYDDTVASALGLVAKP